MTGLWQVGGPGQPDLRRHGPARHPVHRDLVSAAGRADPAPDHPGDLPQGDGLSPAPERPYACVVGARPNLVKAAPLVRTLARDGAPCWVVHTGQHYDHEMSRVFFDELEPSGAGRVPRRGLGEPRRADGDRPGAPRGVAAGEPRARRARDRRRQQHAGGRPGRGEAPRSRRPRRGRLPEPGHEDARGGQPAGDRPHLGPAPRAHRRRPGQPAGRGDRPGADRLVGNLMAETYLAPSGPRGARPGHGSVTGVEPGGYLLATIHRPENTDDPQRLSHICRELAAQPLPVVWPAHPRTRSRAGGRGRRAGQPARDRAPPLPGDDRPRRRARRRWSPIPEASRRRRAWRACRASRCAPAPSGSPRSRRVRTG